jgi:hypothetical protein
MSSIAYAAFLYVRLSLQFACLPRRSAEDAKAGYFATLVSVAVSDFRDQLRMFCIA